MSCDINYVPKSIFTLTRTYAPFGTKPGVGEFSFETAASGELQIAINMESNYGVDATSLLPGDAALSVLLIQLPTDVKTAPPYYSFTSGGSCPFLGYWVGTVPHIINGIDGGGVIYPPENGGLLEGHKIPYVLGYTYLICAYYDAAVDHVEAVKAAVKDGIPGTLEIGERTALNKVEVAVGIAAVVAFGVFAVGVGLVAVMTHNMHVISSLKHH